MIEIHDMLSLNNPLISSQKLMKFLHNQSSREAVEVALFKVSLIAQAAGILLRLPQEVIATSIVLLQRYLITDSNGCGLLEDQQNRADSPAIMSSAACVYLAAKQSFYPLTPRSVVNVYALLTSTNSSVLGFVETSKRSASEMRERPEDKDHLVSEGKYQVRRDKLLAREKDILISLAFDTDVCLPFNLALTYLQALSISDTNLAARVLAHLNGSLLSPQLLYLTHQPHALAVAAIYLAARETEVSLVDEEVAWWDVFDVGREELGFLVLSMNSSRAFFDIAWEKL